MNEFGEIIALEENHAVVRVQRNSACAKCGACQLGCHQDEMLLTIPNRLQGEVGDTVELELSSSQVLKASAITYLLPLGALILGVAGGYLLADALGFNPEIMGAVMGISLTILSFFGIRALDPLFKKGNNFSPQMINIVKGNMKGE